MIQRLLVVVACAACSKASPPAPGPSPEPVAKSIAAPASTAPKAAPLKLVVGGDDGLAAIDDTGKVLEVLSKTPGSQPRWTADRSALLFPSTAGELRRIQVDSRKETVVAKLPDNFIACPAVTVERATLGIQRAEDFALDKAGKHVCIQLMDRNENMADFAVSLEVTLATGAIQQVVTLSQCALDDAHTRTRPEGCVGQLEERTITPPPPKPFSIVKGALTKHGKLGSAGDFGETSVSPSGRWAVIRGNNSEGDYMHSDLFLLDRDAGTVFPIPPDGAAAWPAPIPAGELKTLETCSEKTTGAVGESTILWLDGDLLVIDRTLVVPGARVVKLAGDLARS